MASPRGRLRSSPSAKLVPRRSVQRDKMEKPGLGTAQSHFYCILLASSVTELRLPFYLGGVTKNLGSVF